MCYRAIGISFVVCIVPLGETGRRCFLECDHFRQFRHISSEQSNLQAYECGLTLKERSLFEVAIRLNTFNHFRGENNATQSVVNSSCFNMVRPPTSGFSAVNGAGLSELHTAIGRLAFSQHWSIPHGSVADCSRLLCPYIISFHGT